MIEAEIVLVPLEALLDGLITNGKFCCVRRLRHPVWNNREAILAMDFYVTIGTSACGPISCWCPDPVISPQYAARVSRISSAVLVHT